MYAVIKTGGKQYRVAEGDRVQVERLGEPGSDGATYLDATRSNLDRIAAALGGS